MAVRENHPDQLSLKSRQYSTIKYSLSIIEFVLILLLLFIFLAFGFSSLLAKGLKILFPGDFLVLGLYLFIIYAVYYILSFPLNFYHSFILEHQFQLARQSLKSWFLDQLKAGAVYYAVSLILLEVFLVLVKSQPRDWWWMISVFWIFLSLVLAKLAPILIIPLFFKYKKLPDEDLRQRVISLSRKMKLKILDVYQIDLSRKTSKGNAALVGFGNTRRVILGDTLKNRYTPEEIEVILAHEFAHQKSGHLLKLIFAGALSTLICFFVVFKTSFYVLGLFGLESFNDIAALPLIFVYLVLWSMIFKPWENLLSRRFEIDADKMAIASTGLKDAFISTMDKLAAQNLADRNPNPWIKMFFFDHPAIDERIKRARLA